MTNSEPVCATCKRPETSSTNWFMKLATQLTECSYCGKNLCPNCFTMDPCNDQGDPHQDEQGAV